MNFRSILCALILGAAACGVLLGAPTEEVVAQVAQSKEGQTGGAAAAQRPGMPDAYKMDMLIRTTLIALSQANKTGNYTVVRDLGSPSFQAVNSAAQLSDIFRELRQRRLDFSPILFFNPKLVRQPAIDDAGRLRLTGFVDTKPERINFDMLFEYVGGDWRLFGLGVQMQPAPAPTAAADQKGGPEAKQKSATKAAAPTNAAPTNTKASPPPAKK